MSKLNTHERETLQRLGAEFARIGTLPIQAEKAELWRRLNDGQAERPMVYLNEEPWSELEDEGLVCVCRDPFLRSIETRLRCVLYRWRHYPIDYVVEPIIECPRVWSSTGIGLTQKGETIAHSAVTSQHFEPQIQTMEDIDLIHMPVVRYDEEESLRRRELLEAIFRDIVPIRLTGIRHIWFTPWDELIRLVDIQGVMMDMIDRPDFINALVERYVDAKLHELDQIEALGLLDAGATNDRVGSGGYGYTTALPTDGPEGRRLQCRELWGSGNAQILSDVSPEMHWEFSLRHEMRWLERWGRTYYGCCEPLHRKINILRRVPNLRKISVSPWFDIPTGLDNGAGDYILSIKPNPNVFAGDAFRAEQARADIRRLLDEAQGCQVELVMKDISTVRNDPSRLQRWAAMAMEEVSR